jgi:hypothetical protein
MLTSIMIGTGVAAGAVYGAARAAGWRIPAPVGAVLAAVAAMAGSDGPIVALGISDPRDWGTVDWASDEVPHLAYGAVTALSLAALG